MSRDLKEIFDLEQLRRAWGDPSAKPMADETATSVPVKPAPVETAPTVLIEKLEEAIAEEYPPEQRPLFRPTLEAIRALLGLALTRDLGAARYDELMLHLDELEDLLDSLWLAAAS